MTIPACTGHAHDASWELELGLTENLQRDTGRLCQLSYKLCLHNVLARRVDK